MGNIAKLLLRFEVKKLTGSLLPLIYFPAGGKCKNFYFFYLWGVGNFRLKLV
jgi:hypothetical protein